MTIEMPAEYLEPVKKMPAVKKRGKYKRMKDGNLFTWIAAQAKKLGWIKFDPDTEVWQGVDYDG